MKYAIMIFLLLSFTVSVQWTFTKLPVVDLNFTALTPTDSGYPFSELPNATGAVGQSQYILATYDIVRSFNKKTGQPDGVLNIDMSSFFSAVIGDPRIDYDRFSKRWFLSCEPLNQETFNADAFSLAVSAEGTVTPATQWSFYTFPISQFSPNPNAVTMDYNQGALDQNAYYNGIGVFDDAGNFIGSTLLVIQKSSLESGTPNATFFPGLFPQILGIVAEGFACPANNFDCHPEFGYFMWCIYDNPDATVGNTIQLYRILNAGTTTPTLGPLVTMTLPQQFAYGLIDTAVMAPHKGNLFVASGTAGNLQTGLGRLWTPHVRDKQLYIAQDIQMDANGNADPSGDRVGIRWYQFDLTGDPTGKARFVETPATVPVLVQSGTLFDPSATDPLFYFNASIMTNKKQELILTFTVSGTNAFANAAYAIRKPCDPAGTLRKPILVTNTPFAFNLAPFVSLFPGPEVQRWGDESAAVTDPCNDTDFWLTQQFTAAENYFGIQVTKVAPKH